MTTLLIVLIIIASVVLGFFVLVQKPKGNGLTGSFGSISSQVMGVKQSNDVMEKGTWYSVAVIVALSVFSVFTLNIVNPTKAAKEQTKSQTQQQKSGGNGAQQAPAQ